MQTVWEQVSHNLAIIMPEAQFRVWISPLQAEYSGNVLKITALNEFVAKFVRGRFMDLISAEAEKVLGKQADIIVVAAEAGSSKVELPAEHGKPVTVEATVSVDTPVNFNTTHLSNKAENQAALPLKWSSSATSGKFWRHSFNDFIVGPSNELAHAAARSICKNSSSNFTGVLYLCSSPGLGKTHLMQAVGGGLVQSGNYRTPQVEYLTAEEFATQLRLALRGGEIDRFKTRYRETDVLLLEDIHFLQDKENTQNEILATVSALLERGSKVVFSSSFAPRELRNMDSQLLSRLTSGLIAIIEKPDVETRRKIIFSKALACQIPLSDEIAEYLAEHISSDVRQIESCLQNLALKAKILNQAISLDMAREAIANYLGTTPALTLPGIIRLVCSGFGISNEELNSKSKKQECVQARNAAFFLARKHTGLSLQEIGRQFNRTHSTVIKGITTLEREISRQTTTGRQLAKTIALIEQNGNLSSTSSHN